MTTRPETRSRAPHPFGPPHRRLDVGASQLAYWRMGAGPDLVLVHGWPLHAATFRRIAPALSRTHTLHLFDLPGAGETAWAEDAPLDMPSLAAALARAIDAVGLDRYALLAHDSGGLIARLVAAEHGERVFGVVLGNTEIPGHTPWQIPFFVALSRAPGGGRALLAALRVGFVRRSSLGFGGCFEDPSYVDGEFRELFVEPLLQGGRAAAGALGVVRALGPGADRALERAHPRITAPVCLVWGDRDPFFPLAEARRMVGDFRGGCSLEVLPGAKLFAHEDHAPAFASRALEALARWSPPS